MFLPGRRSASRLAGLARENMLRSWAEGNRSQIERVEDADGRELRPSDVDWTGLDPAPELRPGRPRTPRGRDGAQILVRVSTEERERIQRAADAAGEPVAAWVRDVALRAAR